jgi:predicted Ser/Thr protein kinase
MRQKMATRGAGELRIEILARLGCFKPVYLLRDYISRGRIDKAKEFFGEIAEDLKRYSKDLAEIAQEASRYRGLSSLDVGEAAKIIDAFLNMFKIKVFSSPQGVRLCIYIQPHLEVIYNNLSNMRHDLLRAAKTDNPYARERILKDLEAYLAYISEYVRNIVSTLEKL